VTRTERAATDDVGLLPAKASAHFNEVRLDRFGEAVFPEIRGSFGSLLRPLFEREAVDDRTGGGLRTRGLVERERDPADGRAFVVRLTTHGRRRFSPRPSACSTSSTGSCVTRWDRGIATRG
jgi:hypothetical protein